MTEVFFEVDGKEYCDERAALAEMFASDGLLFVASRMGPFFDPEDGKDDEPATIHVNCNDLFAWGCADSEPLPKTEIGAFYKAWKADEVTKWSCQRRELQPQAPIRERMKKDGTWDDEMEALPKNPDDKS